MCYFALDIYYRNQNSKYLSVWDSQLTGASKSFTLWRQSFTHLTLLSQLSKCNIESSSGRRVISPHNGWRYDHWVLCTCLFPMPLGAGFCSSTGELSGSALSSSSLFVLCKGLTTLAVRGWHKLIGIAIHQPMSMLYTLSATRFPCALLINLFGLGYTHQTVAFLP